MSNDFNLSENIGCDLKGASLGHWLAVEFALREVLDPDEAITAALKLKERGFTVVAPTEAYEAALRQEARGDG